MAFVFAFILHIHARVYSTQLLTPELITIQFPYGFVPLNNSDLTRAAPVSLPSNYPPSPTAVMTLAPSTPRPTSKRRMHLSSRASERSTWKWVEGEQQRQRRRRPRGSQRSLHLSPTLRNAATLAVLATRTISLLVAMTPRTTSEDSAL
jgi:hypothetical protein